MEFIVCFLFNRLDVVGCQKVDGIGKANTGDNTAVTDKSNLDMVLGGLEEQLIPPRKAWVLCDDCHKWRRIPAMLADFIEKTNCRWYFIFYISLYHFICFSNVETLRYSVLAFLALN